MKKIKAIWNWVSRLFFGKTYELEKCADVPDVVDSNSIYLVGEADHEWHLVMECPCGCGAAIYLNLLPDVRPRWSYEIHQGRISIHPSIWRTSGCRSHFWVKEGRLKLAQEG